MKAVRVEHWEESVIVGRECESWATMRGLCHHPAALLTREERELGHFPDIYGIAHQGKYWAGVRVPAGAESNPQSALDDREAILCLELPPMEMMAVPDPSRKYIDQLIYTPYRHQVGGVHLERYSAEANGCYVLQEHYLPLESCRLNFGELRRLAPERREEVRHRYARQFTSMVGSAYADYMAEKALFLWPSLRTAEDTMSREEAIRLLAGLRQTLYLFWDTGRPGHPLYRLGRREVFLISGSELVEYIDDLPLDLYIFDASCSWTIVLTHQSGRQGAMRLTSRVLV